MLTLTRQGLLLSLSATVIPSQGSSDVPVAVVNDINTYVGYTLEPRVGYYLNGIYKSTVCTYDTSAKTFSVPAEAFKQIGIIDITLALIDNANANHIETCQTVHATVNKAPLGTVVLPDQTTWQDYVNSYMNQLFDSNYKPQFDQIQQDLENLVTEAQQQQQTAEQQQTQIDNAISVMGEYQIVSNDPVQIQFKQGDGTFGPTVDLGDGLASKSMVNAGYYQYIGTEYSGSASDYGIEVEEIVGAYTQETTTGAQLFDASKLSTYSEGGATITNNGDGSFTVSGSGETTDSVRKYYNDTNLKPKIGSLNLNIQNVTYPYFYAQLVSSSDDVIKQVTSDSKSVEITEDDVTNTSYMRFGFYATNGSTIKAGTIKPMVYQDGDGTWEPFTGGEPSPNPNYPQKPQFVQIENFNTIGKNLFDVNGMIEQAKNDGFERYCKEVEFKQRNCIYINAVNQAFREDIFLKGLFKPNTQYVLNFTVYTYKEGTTGGGITFQFRYSDGTVSRSINVPIKDEFQTIRSVSDAGKTLIGISFSYSMHFEGYIDIDNSFIVENGETEIYEPFKSSTTPFPLLLRALPNGVADSYENGVITRRVGVAEFDGSSDENWTKNFITNNQNWLYYIYLPNQRKQSIGLCNALPDKNISIMLRNGTSIDINGFTTNYPNNAFYLNVGYYMNEAGLQNTVSDLRTWLQSNPITVWYELATPTTEQLAIPTLQSFYPFTNAWCDSVVQPQQITWNVLTGKSSILDGNGNLIQQGYMTPQDNFFDNADYRQGAINQRGETSYTTSGAKTYTIDGWYIENSGSNLGVGTSFISVVGTFGRRINIVKENETYLAFTIQINLEKAQTIVIDTTTLNEGQDYTYQVDDNITFGIFFFSGQNYAWTYITCINNANIDFMKLERGHKFTGMPVWNYALEYLKCCRELYVWYLPEIPSHGYNSINNLSYFTGTAFPVPFSSAPTWTVKQLLMDQVDVSSDLNTINVTPNRCTSISLTGQISTISGTIIFSNEPS